MQWKFLKKFPPLTWLMSYGNITGTMDSSRPDSSHPLATWIDRHSTPTISHAKSNAQRRICATSSRGEGGPASTSSTASLIKRRATSASRRSRRKLPNDAPGLNVLSRRKEYVPAACPISYAPERRDRTARLSNAHDCRGWLAVDLTLHDLPILD